MKFSRQRFRTLAALMGVWAFGVTAQAAWEATTPGDPRRNWSASVGLREGYDDNVYTSEKNPQGSFSSSIEPQLVVNFPMERSSFGLRYTYRAAWLTSLQNTPLRQTHIGDVFFSYTFTPRLALNLSDSVRSSLNPEEVQDQNGNPVVVQQRGDYLYNTVQGTLSYSLSRRWAISLSGSWDFWQYAEAFYSVPYNRNDYGVTLSAQYSINPQTFLGSAYQFTAVRYETKNLNPATWTDNTWPGVGDPAVPASANTRDGDLNTVYLFLIRQFNPQWSAQLNGGFQWTTFGTGAYATSQSSPYFNATTSYNYAPRSAVSAGLGYAITVAPVSQYRSSDTTSFYLRLDHQLTARLMASIYGTLYFNSYQNPLPGYSLSNQSQTSHLVSFDLTYAFTQWMQIVSSYAFDNVKSDVTGTYTRNRLNLGIRLRY